jgi:hypothetical protein
MLAWMKISASLQSLAKASNISFQIPRCAHLLNDYTPSFSAHSAPANPAKVRLSARYRKFRSTPAGHQPERSHAQQEGTKVQSQPIPHPINQAA